MLFEANYCNWGHCDSISVTAEKRKLTTRTTPRIFQIDEHICMMQTQGTPSRSDLLSLNKANSVILIYVASERRKSDDYISRPEVQIGMKELVPAEIEPQLSYIK